MKQDALIASWMNEEKSYEVNVEGGAVSISSGGLQYKEGIW